jgi:Cu(I)/Ag(I) efflux system periplasmic protein CusF
VRRIAALLVMLAITSLAAAQPSEVHKGTGVVKSVDARKRSVTLAHGPIQSLKWPSMTMAFKAKEDRILEGLKPGQKVEFEFVQEGRD